jgi:hypothetical protein
MPRITVEYVKLSESDREILLEASDALHKLSDPNLSYLAGRLAGLAGRIGYDPEKAEELREILKEAT